MTAVWRALRHDTVPVKCPLMKPNARSAIRVMITDGNQGGPSGRDQHVRRERNEAAHDIGDGDRERASERAPRVWFLESELESHHELDPCGWTGAQGACDVLTLVTREPEALEYLAYLRELGLGLRLNFQLFTPHLTGVMLCLTARGEVTAEPHRDRACYHFGEPRRDD